jgi:hypothetical protein
MSEGQQLLSSPSQSPVFPAQIARIFGKPPILSTESAQAFHSLLSRFAGSLQPMDEIEWFAVWNYTVKTWELLRHYRIRAGIVDMARNEAIYSILEWIGNKPGFESDASKMGSLADGLFNRPGKARDDLLSLLGTYGIDEDAITAEAVILRLHELEAVDRLIALAEAGRNAILRETLFYRQEFATRFREVPGALDLQAQEMPLVESTGEAGATT